MGRFASTWTEETHAALVRLAAAGLTARQIGERLGVSRNAVIGRAGRKGVALLFTYPPAEPRAPRPPRVPSAPRGPRNVHATYDRDIVREMYLAGDTYTAIMNETGYSAATIVTITKDLPRRRHDDVRKRYPQQVRVDAVVALLTGERMSAVSERLGIPRKCLYTWRKVKAVRPFAQIVADRINGEREARERTEATLKAQAEARERMWIDANNAEVFPLMSARDAVMMRMRAAGDTLETCGLAFKVTRERVRQIEVRWRMRGLIIPGAAPLTDAARGMVDRKPIDFYTEAHQLLDGKSASDGKRPYRKRNPEVWERRNAASRERMEAFWAAKRAAS